MADLLVPDISEYQTSLSGITPNLTGLPAVIIRAHNGYRPDNSFVANRRSAHAAGCKVIGLYQYTLGNADPATQARLLLETVGPLQPGEFLICDREESISATNPEAPWYAAWRAVASTVSPVTWLYTGRSFAQEHAIGWVDWLADYAPVEPAMSHHMWQNTDMHQWPWGFSDGSIFHGTVDQLAALVLPAQHTQVQPHEKDGYMQVVVATPPGGAAGQYLIRSTDVIHIPDTTCGTWAWNHFGAGAPTPEAVPWEVILWLNNGQPPA